MLNIAKIYENKTEPKKLGFFMHILPIIGKTKIGRRKIAQKNLQTFVKFVHTFCGDSAIIIHVKTPQYIIYSFY